MKKADSRTKPASDDQPKTKLVYKIDEVSRLTGVDAATLATWEDDFPFLIAGETGSGEKFYRQQDVAIIARVKELLGSQKLTVAGVKRRIEDEFGLPRTNPVHPERLRKTLNNVRDELQEIVAGLGDEGKKKA